ncbi:hypothetical protein WR25_13140 [Diploscapter pachys]|uniref:Uncharacterized protein n=1 Tax=Diploscapter pachys TaxID=2018661 RepID=A0A2A2LPW7_9BILA|nr:hypothetical protein WR25_13140 [Diploscapter pachys]
MSHVNEWYGHFLATRAIPIKRHIANDAIDEGYALVINDLHLSKEIFFHCPHLENGGVYILIEVVEDPKQFSADQTTVAWGMIPVFPTNTAIMEYGHVPSGVISTHRISLYFGSPKALSFSPQLDTPSVGLLEVALMSHDNLKSASDFIPDFCLIGSNEDIPGLKKDDYGIQLRKPLPLPFDQFSFEDISLSFGPHAANIEKLLLDDLNTEKVYKENLSPTKKPFSDLEVMERRLRIGIHNGYTFISEPLVVHLSSIDEQLKGSHSLRRKAKGLFTKSVTDLRSEMNTLFVQSKVSINVPQDARMTVVFALDYLVGERILAGSSLHTQSIVVCWGAWRAYDVISEGGRSHASDHL